MYQLRKPKFVDPSISVFYNANTVSLAHNWDNFTDISYKSDGAPHWFVALESRGNIVDKDIFKSAKQTDFS